MTHTLLFKKRKDVAQYLMNEYTFANKKSRSQFLRAGNGAALFFEISESILAV
jgi:hypothetical protein